jgi:zinc transporter
MNGAWIINAGIAVPVDGATACKQIGTADLVWVHAQAGVGAGPNAIADYAEIPDYARSALLAQETRPRFEPIGGTNGDSAGQGGAIINLRGKGVRTDTKGDPLVSLRMWAAKGLVVSVAFHPLAGLETIQDQIAANQIHDPGDLISALADAITDVLDPEIAELGDVLDKIEQDLDSPASALRLRRKVAPVRSMAIQYRRFVVPQRIAIERLATAEYDWLDADDRVKLRTASDRCARMAEELESVRERAAIVHDELTDLRSERLDARGLQISIIATIFLPLTFLTGLMGMNVGGIPFGQPMEAYPMGFWYITGFCVLVAIITAAWFYWRHWPIQDQDRDRD